MKSKPSQEKKIVFLINPGAGRRTGTKIRRLAPALFKEPEWRCEFHHLEDWRTIRPLSKAAAASGAWAVVAVGGDGTLNQVAQALQGTSCRLGLIPAGTGNGYARALGIPLDVHGACAVIAQGKVRPLDFSAADLDRGFANMLGVGYDAWVAVSANRLRWMNRFSGFLRYLAAGLWCLPRLRPQALRLTLDNKAVIEGRFMMVAVANSPQYGFGCTIAPDAHMNDGLVDVVCVPGLGPITLLRNCVRLFTRKALIGAQFHRCRHVTIESLEGQELAIHMDGEPGGTTPVRLTVMAGALNTLVP